VNRVAGHILLALTLMVSGDLPEAFGQERSIDVSAGRIVFDRVPAAVALPTLAGRPSHLMITFRDTRRTGSWFQTSGAIPTVEGALAWGVAGAGKRLLWPDSGQRRVTAGADLAGRGYVFREPTQQMTGTGGVAEAHGVAIVRAGITAIEIRGGWRGQALSFGGTSSTRSVLETGTRITVSGPVRLDAESRWVRTPDALLPFAGVTLFAYGRSPVYAWAQSGKWFGAAPFDAMSWSAGVGYTLGGHTRVWVNVRQDAPDPLYNNAERRSWGIGLTRRLGGTTPRVSPPAPVSGSTVTIRISVNDAAPGPVSIGGTFNAWQPQAMTREGDEWVVRLTLPAGVYEYAFRTATGDWFVPASVPGRRSDGMGGHAVLLVIP